MQTLDEAECTTATTFTRHDQRITSTAGLREESMYSLLGLDAAVVPIVIGPIAPLSQVPLDSPALRRSSVDKWCLA